MIKKPNRYSRPRKPYEASRIKDENILVEKYGLKNKREILKTIAKVTYFRKRAMSLAKSSTEEQEVLFNKLRGLGLKVNTIADVLALTTEALLQRRLPTVVHKKGFSTTVRDARQMVVHKRVLIDGKVVNVPSYLVYVSEEDKISIRKSNPKKEVKVEQAQEAKA